MSEYTYNQDAKKDWIVTRKGIGGDTCFRICVCTSADSAREIVATLNFCAGVKVPDKMGGLEKLIAKFKQLYEAADYVRKMHVFSHAQRPAGAGTARTLAHVCEVADAALAQFEQKGSE